MPVHAEHARTQGEGVTAQAPRHHNTFKSQHSVSDKDTTYLPENKHWTPWLGTNWGVEFTDEVEKKKKKELNQETTLLEDGECVGLNNSAPCYI